MDRLAFFISLLEPGNELVGGEVSKMIEALRAEG